MKEVFFIAGAQRCGTTYMYKSLDLHPDIEMIKPFRPEPKVFLSKSEITQKEYLDRFNTQLKYLGEKSTSYLDFKEVAGKIKNTFPNAKIIICLRNPVYRAISNYYFTKSFGLETRTIDEVFLNKSKPPIYDKDKISTNPFAYLERGIYSKYLKHYLDVFEDNVHINFLERFTADIKYLNKTLTFLGCKPNETNFIDTKINASNLSDDLDINVIDQLSNFYHKDSMILRNEYNLDLPYE
jgi:hypothetical protein